MKRREKYRDLIFDANRIPLLLHYREGENAVQLPFQAAVPAKRTGGSPPAQLTLVQPGPSRRQPGDDLATATWEDAEWQ